MLVGIGAYTDGSNMSFILRETEASVIVCSSDALKKLDQIEIGSLPSLKEVIVMDEYSGYEAREIYL